MLNFRHFILPQPLLKTISIALLLRKLYCVLPAKSLLLYYTKFLDILQIVTLQIIQVFVDELLVLTCY